ncbi:MAG: phage major capsid protein [Gloeobacteraceae cyanobacterium ES-bin-144]|nr:phage major capsid protein [Verrucomicrobiales bacterium]
MKFIPSLLLLCALATSTYAADAPDPTIKLREQLKSVMLQLRNAQTEQANAQVAQATAEAKNKELEAKVAELTKRGESLVKQSNNDKAAAEETIAKLNNKLEEREKRLVLFSESLEKWKASYQKAAEIARTKEEERAALASEIIVNKRNIADLQSKNVALFNTANEILDRYANYALGKAITAREPFVGTMRVKIENLVQGYKDKILDNRISAQPKP